MTGADVNALFVYGTLLPGRENEWVLAPLAGSWQAAFVHGILHPNGLGAALGYPALILDEAAAAVHGRVFLSAELAAHWPRLDEFEGPAYRRVLTAVQRPGDSPVRAWVYELRQADSD